MNISETTDKFLVAIKEGLQNDEFKMYLQLIVDNKTKNIQGFGKILMSNDRHETYTHIYFSLLTNITENYGV